MKRIPTYEEAYSEHHLYPETRFSAMLQILKKPKFLASRSCPPALTGENLDHRDRSSHWGPGSVSETKPSQAMMSGCGLRWALACAFVARCLGGCPDGEAILVQDECQTPKSMSNNCPSDWAAVEDTSTYQCKKCKDIEYVNRTKGLYCEDPSNKITAEMLAIPFKLACPEGYWCPDASTKKRCKRGHFCATGSDKPRPCNWTEVVEA